MRWLWLYLLLINVITLLVYGSDKRRARKGKWRISEKMLFLLPAIGGSVGALAGMYLFRHKTNHWYFRIGLPTIFLLQLALAAWILYQSV